MYYTTVLTIIEITITLLCNAWSHQTGDRTNNLPRLSIKLTTRLSLSHRCPKFKYIFYIYILISC